MYVIQFARPYKLAIHCQLLMLMPKQHSPHALQYLTADQTCILCNKDSDIKSCKNEACCCNLGSTIASVCCCI